MHMKLLNTTVYLVQIEKEESKSRFCKENNTRSHDSNLSILEGRSKSLPSYSFCGNMQATHAGNP